MKTKTVALFTLLLLFLLTALCFGEEIQELILIDIEQDKVLYIRNEDLWLWGKIQELEARIEKLEKEREDENIVGYDEKGNPIYFNKYMLGNDKFK